MKKSLFWLLLLPQLSKFWLFLNQHMLHWQCPQRKREAAPLTCFPNNLFRFYGTHFQRLHKGIPLQIPNYTNNIKSTGWFTLSNRCGSLEKELSRDISLTAQTFCSWGSLGKTYFDFLSTEWTLYLDMYQIIPSVVVSMALFWFIQMLSCNNLNHYPLICLEKVRRGYGETGHKPKFRATICACVPEYAWFFFTGG